MQVLQNAATMLTQKNGTQHTSEGRKGEYVICDKVMKTFH